MNYLAHAFLSFSDPGILAGNMISDFIKGKKKFDYALIIQKGIELHRAIDTFTDDHEITRRAKVFFKPGYGLYAGAFIDVVYDHFLAIDPVEFPGDTLLKFSQDTYRHLTDFEDVFPEHCQKFFYYMRTQNWLYHYRTIEGISNSFRGVVNRAKYLHEHQTAIGVFEEHYTTLQSCYTAFFPELKKMAWEKFLQLQSQ